MGAAAEPQSHRQQTDRNPNEPSRCPHRTAAPLWRATCDVQRRPFSLWRGVKRATCNRHATRCSKRYAEQPTTPPDKYSSPNQYSRHSPRSNTTGQCRASARAAPAPARSRAAASARRTSLLCRGRARPRCSARTESFAAIPSNPSTPPARGGASVSAAPSACTGPRHAETDAARNGAAMRKAHIGCSEARCARPAHTV